MNKILKNVFGTASVVAIASQLFATSVSAEYDISYAYDYIDSEKSMVIEAMYNGLVLDETAAAIAENEGLVAFNALLTDGYKEKFGDDTEAKEYIAKLFTESIAPYYSTSPEDFNNKLNVAKEEVIGNRIIDAVGDNRVWFDIVLNMRGESAMKYTGKDLFIWATGSDNGTPDYSYGNLVASLDRIYTNVVGEFLDSEDMQFEDMGWTAEAIVSVAREINDYVAFELEEEMGLAKHSIEYELIKAACRSSATVELDGDVIYEDGEHRVDNASADEIVFDVEDADRTRELMLKVLNGRDVANLIGYTSSNENLVQITNNVEDRDNQGGLIPKLNLNFKANTNGIVDIALLRDPARFKTVIGTDGVYNTSSLPSEWIAKLRFVVRYDMSNEYIDINVPQDETERTVSWAPVDNAVKYIMKLYKINSVEETEYLVKEYVLDQPADGDVEKTFVDGDFDGNGKYYIVVQAIGSLEEYEKTDFIDSRIFHIEVSDKISKIEPAPVWNGAEITWTKPATEEGTVINGYEIIVYKDDEALPETIIVSGADTLSCDLNEKLDLSSGAFKVKVRAFSGTDSKIYGEYSDLSDEKRFDKTMVSGYVKLEGGVKNGGYRLSSEGIKVTIGAYSTTTDKDGFFTFANVQGFDGFKKKSYSVVFEALGYITMENTVEISGLEMEIGLKEKPLKLLFGCVRSDCMGYGVDVNDISETIRVSGAYIDEYPQFAHMDYNDDGMIGSNDSSAAIKNAGLVKDSSSGVQYAYKNINFKDYIK